MPASALVVLVTAPAGAKARAIARDLVERRLAACVNVVRGVRSVYRWEGRVHDDREDLLVAKTTRRAFRALRDRVLAIHPYSVPEVLALPVVDAGELYLAWLASEARGPASRR